MLSYVQQGVIINTFHFPSVVLICWSTYQHIDTSTMASYGACCKEMYFKDTMHYNSLFLYKNYLRNRGELSLHLRITRAANKLTSQVDAKVPSEKTIELYDLSPQRIVGSPLRDSWVICVHKWKTVQSDTQVLAFKNIH